MTISVSSSAWNLKFPSRTMGQAQTQAADSSAAAAADEKSSKPFLSEFLESGTCAHCRATGAGFIGHTCDICDKRLCRRCMPHQHTTIDGVTEPRVEGDPTGGDTIARAASKQRGRAVWMCHKCVVTTLPFLSAAPELPTLHPAVVTAPPDVEGIDRPLMEGDGGFVANGFQFSLAKRLAALCSLSYDRETTLAVPTSWGVDGVQTFAGPGRGSMFGFICAASPAWTAEMGA